LELESQEEEIMPKKKKKPLTFGERLQKTIDKHNKRAEDNYRLYAAAAKKQGKKAGEPISIFDL
jgi:hypothetical protein